MPAEIDREWDGIGRRIANARKLRGLTQRRLAERVPCSKSLVAQVESGHKPASQALIAGAACALRVDIGDLTGQPYRHERPRANRAHATIPDLRRALLTWNLPNEDIRPRPLPALRTAVSQASTLGAR